MQRKHSKKSDNEPAKHTPRLFKHKKQGEHEFNQNVSVSVIIEQADEKDGVADCASSCLSACFGLAKKAATS